jgi:pimeloyl-ACP methyl ester carboxylesterase
MCDDGELFLFEQATHWVQHDEAAGVSNLILEFLELP